MFLGRHSSVDHKQQQMKSASTLQLSLKSEGVYKNVLKSLPPLSSVSKSTFSLGYHKPACLFHCWLLRSFCSGPSSSDSGLRKPPII